MKYDYIIVGAGSSGAVLASRLSQDTGCNVLLVEAGKDYSNTDDMPEELRAAHEAVIGSHNWPFRAQVRQAAVSATLKGASAVFSASSNQSRLNMAKAAIKSTLDRNSCLTQFVYPMGKVVGGGSAINGTLALKGAADDYDEWARLGNSEWSWQRVLPYLKKLEHDLDMQGPEYGNSGPVPVQRTPYEKLHAVQKEFFDSCCNLGFTQVDLNRSVPGNGVASIPRNICNGQRVSTAVAYLREVRDRPNLTLLAETCVNKLVFEGNRVSGIEVTNQGITHQYRADRVVLCAGTINTPAILMRSGVGPGEILRSLGIPIVQESPGVGKNLTDHPSVGIWMVPKEGVCSFGEDAHQVMLRYSAPGSQYQDDLQLYMVNSVDTRKIPELNTALGSDMGMSITTVLGKPLSRGSVEIVSTQPDSNPKICLNCAVEESDMERLKSGIRKAWEILNHSKLRSHVQRVFAWNDHIINNDKLLRETISTFVRGSWHPVGTAKMGPENDPMAVVDQKGAVYGCSNLYVADASIMPTIPRVPTNLSCIMLGEKISDQLMQSAHEVDEPEQSQAPLVYAEYI
ncbi:MAG: GMC family oxidoreductase [Gammaproteobacteria bacterium]|nr:GMC family oxidoreductase [Gammaproteobacteria bacterium]MDH5801624.1 GMC family oxidoreductase [Gammaproteobacteria bacterium]